MLPTHEHDELWRTTRRIIDQDINPHVDEWEAGGQCPAHEVMKKLGDAHLIGISRTDRDMKLAAIGGGAMRSCCRSSPGRRA